MAHPPRTSLRYALGECPVTLLKCVAPLLDINMDATSEKAQRLLGWSPRSAQESIVATAESLLRLGLLDRAKP